MTRLNALATVLLVGIGVAASTAQATTTDYTDPAAFAAATSNPTTIGFNGILPPGTLFRSFNPLIVSGVSFSTPTPGTFVDVTTATYYSPPYAAYTADFIVDSANPSPNNQLVISLPAPVHALALDYGGLGFKGAGAAAITLSNGHVFTPASLTTVGHTRFVGFVSTDAITGLTLLTTNDDWVVVDLVLATVGCQVNVTRLSQGDSRWGGNVYDFSSATIRHLGCALTSLSMALNFAGVPNDPGSLNDFLIGQKGGYLDESVGWDVATRTRSGFTLKWHDKRVNSRDNPQAAAQYLDDAVCGQGHPVIVGVNLDSDGNPNHFVLVTGKVGSQFQIADPGFATTSLGDYNNEFVTRGFAADPPGDISGLDVAVGDVAELLLTAPGGQRTGFDATSRQVVEEIPGSVYFRDSLQDDVTGAPAGKTSHLTEVFQVAPGMYQVAVTGLKVGTYVVSVRAFSVDGSPQPATDLPGVAIPGSASLFELQVATAPGAASLLVRAATFQSGLADVGSSLVLHLIDSAGIANSLSRKLDAAAAAAGRGDKQAARNILAAFKNEVVAQTGKHLTSLAARILLEDADALIRSISG